MVCISRRVCNHLQCAAVSWALCIQGNGDTVTLGSTTRYKSKYITTVLYKATPKPAPSASPLQPSPDRALPF